MKYVQLTFRALALLCFVACASGSHAASELVVAIRYLQADGASHAHLYLYREDGKLLRQLTRDESGQDRNPVFSPDGESIVFERALKTGASEFWSIAPQGAALHRLAAVPPWYAATHTSPNFTNNDSGPVTGHDQAYSAPDGSVELVLKWLPDDEETGDQIGSGKHFVLRDLKTHADVELGRLPGFEGLYQCLYLSSAPDQHFLLEDKLRLAFFGLHLNSTDGDTSYALDLVARRLVRLSPNWAAPVPLPGQSAFLTMTSNRYVAIPGSAKTANCNYLERWSAELQPLRYAQPHTPAVTYGASIYRPGMQPAVVTIRDRLE